MQLRLDFVRKLTAVLLVFPLSIELGIEPVHGGEIISHQFESQRLEGNLFGEDPTKTFYVYVPDGYDDSDQRYPTAYWFPGGANEPVFNGAAEIIDDAIRTGRIPPTIVAFMPVATQFGATIYLSSDAFGDWEGFLYSEVIPFIDDTYRTRASRQQRGIIGGSLGGFDAVTQPLFHPETWGAIGANDPSTWMFSAVVREEENMPLGVSLTKAEVEEFFQTMPTSFEQFEEASFSQTLRWQVGAKISPNPNSPMLVDFPMDRQGQWDPDVRESWRHYDIADPNIVGRHLDTLSNLAAVSIVIPEGGAGNARWNAELVETLQSVGVNAKGMNWAGGHDGLHSERFVALLDDVINGLFVRAADFTGDGMLSVADLDRLTIETVAETNGSEFDLTGDRVVDTHDVTTWLTEAARQRGLSYSYLSGDSNLDGTVDAADLNNLANQLAPKRCALVPW